MGEGKLYGLYLVLKIYELLPFFMKVIKNQIKQIRQNKTKHMTFLKEKVYCRIFVSCKQILLVSLSYNSLVVENL